LDLALVNLSERVRMLGGHFEIRTASTSESTVTVRFADGGKAD
jgi:signal transduction histidine kinase